MLDTRSTFDDLIHTYAADDVQARRILDNRFYRNIAGALSGTQEYMAMEKLHELHESGWYDLIVVDTPPTRHALDFLDAPARLTRLLDNRIFRVLMLPTRTGLRVAGVAIQTFFRAVGRVVGGERDRRHRGVLPRVRGHGTGLPRARRRRDRPPGRRRRRRSSW